MLRDPLFPIILLLCSTLGVQAQIDCAPSHPLYQKPFVAIRDTTLRGAAFNLADYKDKLVLVHFWGLRCGPCFKEHPELNFLQKEFSEKIMVISLMPEQPSEILKELVPVDWGYELKKPAYGNSRLEFEIIPNSEELIRSLTTRCVPYGFPVTYFVKNGLLVDISFSYYGGYGNPPVNETPNYNHFKGIIEKHLSNE